MAQERETDPGAGVDVMAGPGIDVIVAAVHKETADAVSITFAVPLTAAAEFKHSAGQFLTVAVPSDRTGHVSRCYSLSSSPGDGSTITVKRVADGYASSWLFENAEPGLVLRLLPPSGQFVVPGKDADVMLAAAGSGVTPVMSILRWLLTEGVGKVDLFYANRDEASVIFKDELDRLLAEYPGRLKVLHWLESERGLPSAEGLTEWAESDSLGDVWTCGPPPFMNAIGKVVGQSRRVHREEYRSLDNDPFAPVAAEEIVASSSDPTVEVELDGEVHTLSWPRDTSLVTLMLSRGIPAPHACQEGWCGSCMCRLDVGTVEMASTEALEDDDRAANYILGCQARPTSDSLKIVFD